MNIIFNLDTNIKRMTFYYYGLVLLPCLVSFYKRAFYQFYFFLLFASCSFSKKERTISVIPIPMEYELQKGYFSIDLLAIFSGALSPKVKCVIMCESCSI